MKLNYNAEGLLTFINGTVAKPNDQDTVQQRTEWVKDFVGDGGIRLGGYSSNFATAKLGVKGYGYVGINGLETPKDYPSEVNFVQDIKKLFPENEIMYTHSVHSRGSYFSFAANLMKPSVIELGNEVYLKKYKHSAMDFGIECLSAQGYISAYGQFSELCVNIPPKKDSTFLSMVKNTKYLNIDAISIHCYENNPEEIIDLVQFLESETGKDVYVSEVHLNLDWWKETFPEVLYKGKLQIFGGDLHAKAKDRGIRMAKRDALRNIAVERFKELIRDLYNAGHEFWIHNLCGHGQYAMVDKHGLTLWGLALLEVVDEFKNQA